MRPEKPAIVLADRVVTYDMVAQGILRAADRIRALEIPRHALVGIAIESPIRHMILASALYRLGHPTLSVDKIADVLPLPFPAASFSLVFTRYSFHHFLDPKAVLAEMVRVCSPGGRVVVVDVFMSSPEQAEAYNHMEKLRDPSHMRALALEELIGLFAEAGFRDVKQHFYKHEVEPRRRRNA